MYREIKKCRICGNTNLTPIISLGDQTLTGVFPRDCSQPLTAGPLELVKCDETKSGKHCGLVQLRHSYQLSELYGQNYGYRSGLNPSMVRHLRSMVAHIMSQVTLNTGDIVVDIGSNDSTLLQSYPHDGISLIGIDPTGAKFKEHYPPHVRLIPEFFSATKLKEVSGGKRARIITSIAMFYDLEDPVDFMRQIYESLDDDGVWVFEQSYMPTMLEVNAYDTICHEHLEYYGLKQIKWMTDEVGFKILDVNLNDVNGGSFIVTVGKDTNARKENSNRVAEILEAEDIAGLSSVKPFMEFRDRVYNHKNALREFIHRLNSEKKKILGYGASTKGNVILQFCNLTNSDIPYIAEVNSDKYGAFTPGTCIPIISESAARQLHPDYFLVLPWHFKSFIIEKERSYMKSGGKLIFPLPEIQVT
jgi:NDP-4-keto-2,6-dideoxyhexose 3-C-methyltransferase